MTAFSVLDNVDDYEAGPGAVTRQTRESYSVTAGASGPGVGDIADIAGTTAQWISV